MPKKKATPPANQRLSDMKEKFLERAAELWDMHIEDAMTILESSESKKFNLTFHAKLDFSESTAKLETEISFSQQHRDRRQDDFEDPRGGTPLNQGVLVEGTSKAGYEARIVPPEDPDGEGGPKKRRRKSGKMAAAGTDS